MAYVRLNETQVGFEPGANPFDTSARHVEMQLTLAVRVRPWLWSELVIPYAHKVLDNPLLPKGGVPGHPDVPHKELQGLGDVRLWQRVRALDWLTVSVGLLLPTGETAPNPFAKESSGHTVMQLGNGTVNPMVEANVAIPTGPVDLLGNALAVIVPYANNHGFEAGDAVIVDVGVAWPIFERRFQPQFGLTTWWRNEDRMPLVLIEDTGGTSLYASPAVKVEVLKNLWFDTVLRVPIVQYMNSLQLVEDFQLFVGVTFNVENPHPRRR